MVLRREEGLPSYSLVGFVRKCALLAVVSFFRRRRGIDVRVYEVAASSGLWVTQIASFGFGTNVFGIVYFFLFRCHNIFPAARCVCVSGIVFRWVALRPEFGWPGSLV